MNEDKSEIVRRELLKLQSGTVSKHEDTQVRYTVFMMMFTDLQNRCDMYIFFHST